MKPPYHFLPFTFVILISCQTSSNQQPALEHKENADSSLTKIDSSHNETKSDTAGFHSFIGMLNDGLDSIHATINDSTIFVATKGELFLYQTNSENAWIADGRSAYIPFDQVKRVDTPCFRFNFSKWDFVKEKDYELADAAHRQKLDLNSLIKKIRMKDEKALVQFFNLRNHVDGAAAEEYPYDFWALINVWPDKELSTFIKHLPTNDRTLFCNELLDDAPLPGALEYFHLYYPLTFVQIQIYV